MLRRCLFLLFLVFIGEMLYAQRDLMRIEGYVLSSDSLKPIQNAHIISKIASRGSISDRDGKFSLVVATIDTLLLTSIGFERKLLAFDKQLIENQQQLRVLLKKEVFLLNEVVVKPFPDYRTFKETIIKMESKLPQEITLFEKPKNFGENKSRLLPPAGGLIQMFYNIFNEKAVRDRRLKRNRKNYNKNLVKSGREEEQIPIKLNIDN
ncbi:MAG: carboxypeptidase-like regulatory domain-containing protein [Lentimicrobiaceae bacterium]|jgi:hypothetical protein|nr:carboxypeptidase-like regulatory domain-containing protein [Lentimicrobiaceae bacterium]